MITNAASLSAIFAALAAPALAQPQAQAVFDVASVRAAPDGASRNPDGGKKYPDEGAVSITPGSVRMLHATVRGMIAWAYGVRDYQISGPPAIASDRYDIMAKADGAASESQLKVMFQDLLADRFKLALHREKKELNTLVLTVGKGAPNLRKVEPGSGPQIRVDGSRILFLNYSIAALAEYLTRSAGRPVLDATGLNGAFDFSAQMAQSENPVDVKIAMRDAIGDGSLARIIANEIGLKLESRKEPTDILIVDRAEKPSEN
jgi:uncharacterized protein (TIGR03435 family)